MAKWSEAQKRYYHSDKGKLARKKYQSSEKAKETRKRYLERRKAKLAELKQKQAEEIEPVKNEGKTVKIKKVPTEKKS